MNTRSPHFRRRRTGFTLVEVLISLSIVVTVMGLALGTYLFGLRTMYKDAERLATNASLRYFVAQVSKETLDASEFYIFPYYTSLNGSVNLDTDVTNIVTSSYGINLYHGDCLVLVTRVSLEATSAIRQFRIYYRVVTASGQEGPIRYYESPDYGTGSTHASVATLLNGVNLAANPAIAGSRQLTARARGRPRDGFPNEIYPIFSSEFPTLTKTNENVSINVEIINGVSATNMLSSSSFNYTISPRR